jgi:hypothetical protein
MHRYYNPELTSAERAALDWANFAQLMVGQSLLGSITPRMLAIVVRTTFERTIHVDVYTDAELDDDRIEVEDALSDLENYLSHLPFTVGVSASVRVDPNFIPRPDMRLVLLRSPAACQPRE